MVLGVALLIAALDRARAVARTGAPARALGARAGCERGGRDCWRERAAPSCPRWRCSARPFSSPRAGSGCDSRRRACCGAGQARWWERRFRSGWPGSRSDSTPRRTSASSWERAARRSLIAPRMVFLALATLAPLAPPAGAGGVPDRSRSVAPAACSASPSVRSSLAGALCDHTPIALALLLIGGADRHRRGEEPARRTLGTLAHGAGADLPDRRGVVGDPLSQRTALALGSRSGGAVRAPRSTRARWSWRTRWTRSSIRRERARSWRCRPRPGAERDLAVALWRRSPLARRDVASAVQVDVGAAEPSLFSYGLTVRDGEIDPESLPPAGVRADHWIDGGATVVQSGARRRRLENRRPSCSGSCRWRRRPDRATFEELEVDLLRGRLAVEGVCSPRRRLAGGARGRSRAADAVAAIDASRARAERRRASRRTARPGSGRCATATTTTTVYLPRLGPLAGLERIGIHAVGALLATAVRRRARTAAHARRRHRPAPPERGSALLLAPPHPHSHRADRRAAAAARRRPRPRARSTPGDRASRRGGGRARGGAARVERLPARARARLRHPRRARAGGARLAGAGGGSRGQRLLGVAVVRVEPSRAVHRRPAADAHPRGRVLRARAAGRTRWRRAPEPPPAAPTSSSTRRSRWRRPTSRSIAASTCRLRSWRRRKRWASSSRD